MKQAKEAEAGQLLGWAVECQGTRRTGHQHCLAVDQSAALHSTQHSYQSEIHTVGHCSNNNNNNTQTPV